MTRLSAGTKAPPFSLPDQDGNVVSLREFRGQTLVVYFYPADDTPGCTTEACEFNDLLSAFRRSRTQVIGISPDDAASHRAFRKKFALKFPLLSDSSHAVMTKYGAYGEKMLYGKTVIGVIRSTFVINDAGVIEHALYGVRTKGHAARVLEQLAS